jgi:hypothetical protein
LLKNWPPWVEGRLKGHPQSEVKLVCDDLIKGSCIKSTIGKELIFSVGCKMEEAGGWPRKMMLTVSAESPFSFQAFPKSILNGIHIKMNEKHLNIALFSMKHLSTL